MQQRFSLTFLGVGAGLSPELGNTNVLLESEDRTVNLLVDCGPITASELKIGGRLPVIQQVFLTHVHDDHVGGLHLWAQLNRYVYKQRPLMFYREELFDELWNGSLRGGLEAVSAANGQPGTVGLDAYFDPQVLAPGDVVSVPGLPVLTPRESLHVEGKPSFGFFLGEDVFYSSDSQELPPSHGPTGKPLRVIFQDCQLFESRHDVHTPLARLIREMPAEQKAITYLMHYNHEPEVDAVELGFKGFVRRHEPVWI